MENLDYLQYLSLRRDAFVYRLSQTPEGKDYLDNAWRLEQTKLDAGSRARLRTLFGGER